MTASRAPAGAARLLRIELRRTPAWLPLPALTVLLGLASPYGRALRAPVALWSARSLALPGALQVIGPFVAGIAAWAASREARRQLTDLLTTSPRSPLARRLATWAAATAVGLAFYGLAAGFIFAATAWQDAWGAPLWGPVAVGALGVVAFSGVGFAIGVLLPSRFTPPLVAIGFLFGLQLTLAAWYATGSRYALASPVVDSVGPGAVPFFGDGTGVVVVQLLLLAGVVVAALGVPGLTDPSTTRGTRLLATALVAAGLCLGGTAIGLARTARHEPGRGTVIPRLAGTATVVPYTPVCDRTGPLPVCAHPAYRQVLATVSTDLTALTGQFAGLPGAPTAIDVGTPGGVPTDPGVLRIDAPNSQGPMSPGLIRYVTRETAAGALLGIEPDQPATATPARRAVADGLLLAAGETLTTHGPLTADQQRARAAAQRFAALPATARRAWLAAHLTALRAGTLTLEQLP